MPILQAKKNVLANNDIGAGRQRDYGGCAAQFKSSPRQKLSRRIDIVPIEREAPELSVSLSAARVLCKSKSQLDLTVAAVVAEQ